MRRAIDAVFHCSGNRPTPPSRELPRSPCANPSICKVHRPVPACRAVSCGALDSKARVKEGSLTYPSPQPIEDRRIASVYPYKSERLEQFSAIPAMCPSVRGATRDVVAFSIEGRVGFCFATSPAILNRSTG